MRKKTKIDLIDVPWPVNLLKCHRYTGEMQPGDEMVIIVKGEDVKDSLLLILHAMPELSFGVSAIGSGYAIDITKNRSRISTKESDFTGGK